MTAFAPLPVPVTQAGKARRVGVEIEFAGLSVPQTAKVVTACLGGTPAASGQPSGTADAEMDTQIGSIRIELDTALTQVTAGRVGDALHDMLRHVVPVEIVTDPLELSNLPKLDALCAALRAAGARGSRDGIVYGFGVHLNVEIAGRRSPHTARTIQAFACLEPLLRADMALDATRRVLPFVNPWPPGLVADVLAADAPDLTDLSVLYARHTRTRNHGLDLLPLLKWADPAGFNHRFAGAKTAARPAFHFRLPESRIDEAGWGLAQAWAQWHLVETLAADAPRLAAASAARQAGASPEDIRDVMSGITPERVHDA
ncbi:MAG: amidoligase family protein [Pseudomonadota bacterium]